MSIKSKILDGRGSDRCAGVTPALSMQVQQVPVSARGLPIDVIANLSVLIEKFSDPAGATEQVVDGSVTPVEFSITEEKGFTKWVTGFRLVLIGPGLDISTNQIRNYGSTGGGLTNGVEIEVEQKGIVTPITLDPVQRLSDYFPYQEGFLNLVGVISAADDLLNLDFTFPTPVVLTSGSKDKVTLRVNDDLTAALNTADSTQFAVARGYKEAE